jgi:hypothetical protein
LRHDHGSVYMSDDFQAEIRFAGMESKVDPIVKTSFGPQ